MNIALCDDNFVDIKNLENFITIFCQQNEISASINCFSSAQKFLDANKDMNFNLVFMDIYMNDMNGIEAIKKMREYSEGSVVFTTISQEHAIEAFGLNAIHYLVKPIQYTDVVMCMERYFNHYSNRTHKMIQVKVGKDDLSVSQNHIDYVEVYNKISVIHFSSHSISREIRTYTSLKSIFEMLDTDLFIKVNRSYVVNMNFIDLFYWEYIILKNGMKVMLSRNSRKHTKEQYQQFLFNLAKGERI